MITTWKNLNSINQLEDIQVESKDKLTVLFKHSTRCGISLHAKHKLESDWNFKEGDLNFYYLDLLNHRDVSNEIAQRYNVVHQSPQIILLKGGEAIFDTSHNAISTKAIKSYL